MTESELKALVAAAEARYQAMTSEQQAAMRQAQRRSWIIGESGFGNDADEAAYADAVTRNDTTEIDRLDMEAEKRIEAVTVWLNEDES